VRGWSIGIPADDAGQVFARALNHSCCSTWYTLSAEEDRPASTMSSPKARRQSPDVDSSVDRTGTAVGERNVYIFPTQCSAPKCGSSRLPRRPLLFTGNTATVVPTQQRCYLQASIANRKLCTHIVHCHTELSNCGTFTYHGNHGAFFQITSYRSLPTLFLTTGSLPRQSIAVLELVRLCDLDNVAVCHQSS